MRYKAFISYSNSVDGKLAPALQSALQRFAKPWYAVRALRVFRDSTALSATPELWPDIKKALDASEFMLFLASPQAANSKWVSKELEYWCETKDPKRIQIVLTAGEVAWDEASDDFDWARTDAVPKSLKGRFESEPRYLDFRGFEPSQCNLDTEKFLDHLASLAAPLHGRSKDEMFGEHIRQHRKTMRWVWSGASLLTALTLLAIVSALFANTKRREASHRLAETQWQLAQLGRGEPFASFKLSPAKAAHHLLRAAQALEHAGNPSGAANAALAARLADRGQIATLMHSGAVLGSANSPDHRLVLTWCDDGTVWLWRAADGQPVGAPMKHGKEVTWAGFSPYGQRILSWSQDGTARLWQVADAQPVGAPMKHDGWLNGAEFSPDGQRILSWTADGTVQQWQAADGRPTGSPMKHDGFVMAVFSARGEQILSWSYDGTARLWQAADGQPVGSPMEHGGLLNGAAFSPDGERILSWSDDGTARLWQAADGRPVGTPMKHEMHGEMLGIWAEFSPDGQRILTWSSSLSHFDGEVRLWRAVDGGPVGEPMKHAGVREAVFSPDSQRILSWSQAGTALWQAADGRPVGTPMKQGWLNRATFSPDGQRILSWGEDGTARLWQATDGQAVGAPMELSSGVEGAEFSPDGQRILTWSKGHSRHHAIYHDGEVKLWQAADGSPVDAPLEHVWSTDAKSRRWSSRFQDIEQHMNSEWTVGGAVFIGNGQGILSWSGSTARLWQAGGANSVVSMKHEDGVYWAQYSADGRRILSLSGTPAVTELRLWQAANGQPVGERARVDDASFSPDGQRILSWGDDGTVRLWQAADGQPVGAPMRHEAAVYGAVFSPAGQRILSWGRDSTARMWQAADGQPVGEPMKHALEYERGVRKAVFSPDGQRILTMAESTTWLWCAANSQLMSTFRHQNTVTSACFDEKGQRIMTASEDGTVALWDISFDPTIPIEERLVEFEVRSATTLETNGELRVLTEAEWTARKVRLAELRRKRGVP